MNRLKSWVASNYIPVLIWAMFDNYRQWLRTLRGNFFTDSGTRHDRSKVNLDQSLNYIEEVFGDYKKYGRLKRFEGKVLEIGPGDNAGVALLMLANGAGKTVLIDKYYPTRDEEYQKEIYLKLARRHRKIKDLLDERVLGTRLRGVEWRFGPKASAERFLATKRRFDFIVSRAVMEHVDDPIKVLRLMAESLVPGGMLLHKVDLTDHNFLTPKYHQLKYLEIPSLIYHLMSFANDRPNRVRINRYREILEEKRLKYELLITNLIGVGKINPHLPYEQIELKLRKRAIKYVRRYQDKLSGAFKDCSVEDLSIGGFFLIARKGK